MLKSNAQDFKTNHGEIASNNTFLAKNGKNTNIFSITQNETERKYVVPK